MIAAIEISQIIMDFRKRLPVYEALENEPNAHEEDRAWQSNAFKPK